MLLWKLNFFNKQLPYINFIIFASPFSPCSTKDIHLGIVSFKVLMVIFFIFTQI